MIRIRKDARLFTQDERDQYVAAIKARAGTSNGSNKYDEYAKLHQALSNSVHDHDIFLPWHRAFLLAFEDDLRQLSGFENVTLPYWNWADDSSLADQKAGVLWDKRFLGGIGSNSGYGPDVPAPPGQQRSRIIDGNFANWTGPNNMVLTRSLGRNGLGKLYRPSEIEKYIRIKSFGNSGGENGFRHRLEFGAHANAHNWVGGTMANMAISPIDPSFWSLHGFVDLIYERWTRNALSAGWDLFPDGADTPMPRANPSVNKSVTPTDVWSCRTLGYQYDMLSFDDGHWDSLANLRGDTLHATKGGFILRFRPIGRGKYAADERKLLSDVFYDLPGDFRFGIDSMSRLPDGRIYLFKGDRYAVYNHMNKPPVNGQSGSITALLGANGPKRIDTICRYQNGKVFVTAGSEVWRYTRMSGQFHLDADYPRALTREWRELPSNYHRKLDAVVQAKNGDIYVLNGTDFARYTQKSYPRQDGRRPVPINRNWIVREALLRKGTTPAV